MGEAAGSAPPVDALAKDCSGEKPVPSLSPPLSPIPRPSPPLPSTAAIASARTVPVFERDVLLGYVDVFLPPGIPSSSSDLFPGNEIRIRRRSPASDRCPPLAVLQMISAYSMRCKLRESTLEDLHPGSLDSLHSTCWNQRMTAVVEAGAEELHLVAMQSKVEGVPCFWCWSAQKGLYTACLGMLNQRRLSIVLDLDQTLLSCYYDRTFKTLMKKIESSLENRELDAAKQLALRDRLTKVSKDRMFLKDYAEKRAITVDDEIVRSQQEKSMLHKPGGLRQVIVRPVIRLPARNAVLTCLDPTEPGSNYFVNIRPGWDDLKSYLITNGGCRRYKVYICTMAGRYYALEAWRLLDPQGSLISSEDMSQRLICVRQGSKKSLQRVFQKSLCHPNMAMVIDDRMDVWDEKDKRRVHNLPAYNPSVAPEDEAVHGPSVLQSVGSIARKVHKGFFSEFDGMLLKTVDELMYENDVLDLPYPPDVGDYLQPKNNKNVRHSDSLISPKYTSRAEVQHGSKN